MSITTSWWMKSAQKDAAGLPTTIRLAAADEFACLADYLNVAGVKALEGSWKGHHRTVIAQNYRALHPLNRAVTVVAASDRKEAY
jgi:hypothetical protein